MSDRFTNFVVTPANPSPLRRAISEAHRMPEAEALCFLLERARLDPELRPRVADATRQLLTEIRRRGKGGGVEGLVAEYSLATQEGVALMCLAEALLRVPDAATRDALIRDKISAGDWRSHLGDDLSIFVNAATWGLVVSGKLLSHVKKDSLRASLTGLIRRAGEPVIRSGVEVAMKLMGERFITGESIAKALDQAQAQEAKGFTYSYDMLGEAAMTMVDAQAHYAEYVHALHAIGKTADGRGVYRGPGISIKLSALHPRYERTQFKRVMDELLPKVRKLALLAKGYDIGLNIDAEESDRLEMSLDILDALAFDPELADWDGLGFVVQAYGKRARAVIEYIVDLAQRSGHRIMVRLVKGAYWDSEIKRAQVDGVVDFPVFIRKVHTDVSYIACARELLSHREHVFPQFATHNAQTLATIYALAGEKFAHGDYEFQCLHGMGEPLYDQVVGVGGLKRPCRIYAPVGTHEKLLAYLVRRLLENGANSSFVNRIWDSAVSLEELVADPVDEVEAIEPLGSSHSRIRLPRELYVERLNSRGLDLADESVLAALASTLKTSNAAMWRAEPTFAEDATPDSEEVRNPADQRDRVGTVLWTSIEGARVAMRRAAGALDGWATTPVARRAECLEKAADILEARMENLLGLIIREAGKTAANAVAEVREAVDFLRYYAGQARVRLGDTKPLGPVICISPWNFPLAIFTGQVAAALAAGNTVLAKPAEETPLIAAQMVAILHEAGVPKHVLQLLPGAGEVGGTLVAAPETRGVIFTGSTEVAKIIQRQLATRPLCGGSAIPLIAETGGQNAMLVDSSALLEQVVRDVIASAFDSAGQRCSALRILCVQDDVADDLLAMLRGAVAELRVGTTDMLSSDVGPVISYQAQATITAHIEAMRSSGKKVDQFGLDAETAFGIFVAPAIIEIDDIAQLGREVFGPALHVLRYERRHMRNIMRQINETGYGLTLGLHSRIDQTIAEVLDLAKVGNVYVNRNVIGAIVGVQPFGGHGLSGTGPKAGGPLYLGRLVQCATSCAPSPDTTLELPGPVGERNLYMVRPRGRTLLLAVSSEGLADQLAAVHATGNCAVMPDSARSLAIVLPAEHIMQVEWVQDWCAEPPFAHVLIEQRDENIAPILTAIAEKDGPIPIVQMGGPGTPYRTDWMVNEISVSIDMTAAGGNAYLMAAL